MADHLVCPVCAVGGFPRPGLKLSQVSSGREGGGSPGKAPLERVCLAKAGVHHPFLSWICPSGPRPVQAYLSILVKNNLARTRTSSKADVIVCNRSAGEGGKG